MFFRLLILCVLTLFLAGCGFSIADLTYLPPNAHTGYYETFFSVNPNEIIVDKKVDLKKYNRLLVVGIRAPILQYLSLFNHNGMTSDEKFWTRSVNSLGYFSNVIPVSQIGNFLNHNGYTVGEIQIIQASNLKAISNIYGNFLLLEITNMNNGCILKIIDPKTNETLFMIQRNQHIYISLSQQFYYPMLNALKDWLKSNDE